MIGHDRAHSTVLKPSPNQKEMDGAPQSQPEILCKGSQAVTILEQPELFLVGTGFPGHSFFKVPNLRILK